MSSPLLWGPNNTSNNLQNQILLANGQLLSNNGPKNYIANSNFENGQTTGWTTFLTSLTGKIPTGSLSLNPGTVSLSINTGSTISGTNSLVFSGDSSTINSYGFASDAFTIDKSDQAKVLSFKFNYKITNANVNCSGTDSNTFAIYIRDVTNSSWIQPAGVYNIVQNSGIGTATGTFQTTANSTQYRICLVIINNILGLSLIEVDDVFVGPQVTSIAPAMSDWVNYTPTWTNLTVGNGTQTFRWKQVGDSMLISGKLAWGSTTSASGTVQVSLPSGYSINQSKMNSSSFARVGTAWIFDAAGTAQREVFRVIQTSTSNVFQVEGRTDAGVAGAVNATFPITWATGDEIDYLFEVPIQGWSSNTVSSADTDTRVIAGQFSTSTGTITNGGTDVIVPLSTTNVNQGGMVFTSGASANIVIPVSGTYRITTTIGYTNSGITGAQTIGYKINTSATVNIGVRAAPAIFDTITGYSNIDLKAGDVVYMIARNPHSSNLTIDGARISIERLSGPAVVQATETVAARYLNISGTAISDSEAVLDFPTKDYDYTNSVTTGANWKFTAPISGLYNIKVNILTETNNSINSLIGRIVKNGNAAISTVSSREVANSTYLGLTLEANLKLLAGDYISFALFELVNSQTLLGVGTYNSIEIIRVGN